MIPRTIRRALVRCLPALLALLAAAPSARGEQESGDLTVSYPPDMTIVERADLSVEGYTRKADLEEIEVRVNDNRPVRVLLHDQFFAEEVSLDEGLNTLRIGSVTRRVWLATERSKPPGVYQRVYGHVGLSDGCLECHERDDDGKLTLAGEREELCGWCHGDITRGRLGVPWVSVHSPARSGKCLECHAPHLSAVKGLPAEKAPKCADCHTAVTDRLKTDRFVHGPMNLGDCRLCHAVHASAEPKLLVRPATALCTDCHSDALPPAGAPAALQPHTMIPQGQCGRCHEPHSSANQRMLREPAGRLCQGCHEGKTRSFHEAKGFSIYVCAKCHDLHRPTQAHLIIDASRSLCTQCHDFGGQAVFTHSFVSQGQCFLCHSFHESPLAGDIATICLGCHRDNPRLPAAHGGIAIERSRCTNCHLPHQAQRKHLLRSEEHRPFAARECASCHGERAAKIGPVFRPLCLECHPGKALAADAAGASTVHPPFRDEDCSRCHESHNARSPGVLRVPQGELCLGCHRKMRKSMVLTPVSAHPAVLAGRCGECHEPHASPNDHLLRLPPVELCPSCHGALGRSPAGEAWPVTHEPVAKGKCRLCHRSHTATSPALLKAPLPQPCRPCHTELFARIEAADARSTHAPVKEGSCGICHQVHGSAAAGLLKEGGRREVCLGCHPSPKGSHHHFGRAELEARDGGAGAGGRGCTHCHRPHVSGERRLLLDANDRVCRGCHST